MPPPSIPAPHSIEYNTEKDYLIYPEYGRNVQLLIQHAKTIKNQQEKQAFVESIVDLMFQMNPQSKNVDDYKIKLWKHTFRIANYELDGVVPSIGEIPTPEDLYKKPERVAYPLSGAQFRHYGNNVQQLIKKGLTMEAGPTRDGFIETIGSYMKLAYKTWNKEYYVSDDIIKNDLETLSKGRLTLESDVSIDGLSNAKRNSTRREGQSSSPSNNNNNRSNSNYRDNRGGSGDNRDRGNDRSGKGNSGSYSNNNNRGRTNNNNNSNNNNNKRR